MSYLLTILLYSLNKGAHGRAPLRNNGFSGFCKSILLIILIIMLTGCCCPPPSQISESKSNTTSTTNSNEKKPEKTVYKLNDVFTHGDFRYKITEVSKTNKIGNKYSVVKASEGGVFIIVNFTEENLSKETKTVYSERFLLIDNKEREFRSSSKGTTALAMSSANKDFLLSEVQPGIKHKSVIVFEVPEDSAALTIKIPGGWSTEDVYVKLLE